MKKSIVFIFIILIICLLAFPVVYAEEVTFVGDNSKDLDITVMSNMDNYMKLSDPRAIDKTKDYLAVSNRSTLFIQPQNDKVNAYYLNLDLEDGETITDIVISDNYVIALVQNKTTKTRLIAVNAQNKTQSSITKYSSIFRLTKRGQQAAIVNGDKLYVFDSIVDDQYTEYILELGTINKRTFKFCNDTAYVYNNESMCIHRCELTTSGKYEIQAITNEDTWQYIGKNINDYIVQGESIHYIDTNNNLYIGGKLINMPNIRFEQLTSYGDEILVTAVATDTAQADNGKVYVFDTAGAQTNYITSKGNDLYRFDSPHGVFSSGGYIYVADTNNKRILKRSSVNDERVQFNLPHRPIKVATVGETIYYIDDNKQLYELADSTSKPICEETQSIAVYNDKLLILTDNKVLTYNGTNTSPLIECKGFVADTLCTAVSTNYAYTINSTTGQIAKYNLENPETPVFTDTVQVGRNYNIDYRGNLYVENGGIITKYRQKFKDSGSFEEEDFFSIGVIDPDDKIAIAINGEDACMFFVNTTDHLLFKIDGQKLGLVGTNNINYPHPSEYDIIKAGVVKEGTTAYITPDNPESARNVPKDDIFLILAKVEYNTEQFYYVTAEHLSQKEYIACDMLDVADNIDMQSQTMSALVSNVAVYTHPFKFADKLLINGQPLNLDPHTHFTCVAKVADSDIWNWYKIKLNIGGSEYTGYVYADYCAKVVATTPPQNIMFMRTKAAKIGTNINIYEKPDINSTILFDDVKDGIDIEIIGQFDANTTFTKVYYNGMEGYILNENLQPNGLTPNQIIAITVTSVAIVAFTIIGLLFVRKNKNKRKVENIEPDILS